MKKFVVYKEYLDLLNLLINRFKLFDEDKEKLFLHSNQFYNETQLISYNSKDFTKFTLRVDRTAHPITWEKKEGRIFEIIGNNSRNKTTTLIFTATLLGVDWEEIAPYIEDSKILKQAKLIRKEISDGLPVYLSLENNKYRFEVDIRNSVANALWWENGKEIQEKHLSFNDISLSDNLDWKEYQNKIGGFFDVQVVGVGRNFITQVGFEEATNLVLFCKEVCDYISGYNQMLLAQKPKMNPTILRAQILEQEKKLRDFGVDLKDIKQNISLTKSILFETQNDLNKCKDFFSDNYIKQYFELLNKNELGSELHKTIDSLSKEIEEIERQIAQFQEAVATSETNVTALNEFISSVADAYSIIMPDLNMPSHLKEGFLSSLINKDISAILNCINILLLDEKTQKAHISIYTYNFSGISLSTKLLGLSYFEDNVKNLSELKEKMEVAASNAYSLFKINDKLKLLLQIITHSGYDSTDKYLEEISGINELKNIIDNLKVSLIVKNQELAESKSKLSDILVPYDSYVELGNATKEALKLIDAKIIGQLEQIAEDNNIGLNIAIIDSLTETIIRLNTVLQQNANRKEDLERYIKNTKQKIKKFKEALDEIDESNQIDARVNALLRVKEFLSNVAEYFTYKRKHFENQSSDSEYERYYTNNMNNLGDDFELIVNMVNKRIKDRCPFAFVNLENGVEKRQVKSYDFLNSSFEVEDLQEVSQYHGGITSSMTVYGLATRKTGAEFGSILLVDEWGDVGVYKEYVFEALSNINHLALAIFVDVDKNETITKFKAW